MLDMNSQFSMGSRFRGNDGAQSNTEQLLRVCFRQPAPIACPFPLRRQAFNVPSATIKK
jgi:hypothetical protein